MNSLANLEFLSGCTETAEAFNFYYESLLNECKASNDQQTLKAMREIAQRQAEYLASELFKEAANDEQVESL